jgi:lipoprotein-anchoring transpeptidase ErfK/SrfK
MRWPHAVPILTLAACLSACGGDDEPRATLPERDVDPRPHFDPAEASTPAPAAIPRARYLIAALKRPTWLRSAPGGRRLAHIRTRTEFGSRQVLSVVGREDGWLQVVHTRLGNGKTGWLPERRARLGGTNWSVHVDRSAHRVTLRRAGKVVRRFPVAVGKPGAETPLGRFAVSDKLRPTNDTSPYGCCAVALSGHQTKLQPGWIGGDRLAIHGTPQPETVGKAVSLGCMRAHRKDAEALMQRLPLGAPVFIRA